MDVCIRNISTKGLMLQADAAPPRGTYVEIVGAEQTIVGRVVWAKDRRFGIHSCVAIDVAAAIGGIPARPSHPGPTSRRAAPCAAIARPSVESHRMLAKVMEFVAIGGFAAMLVVALAMASYGALSRPFERVSFQLGDGR